MGENIIGAPKMQNNYGAFINLSNIALAILFFFSIAPCKVFALNFKASFFVSALFLRLISLPKAIAIVVTR